MKFPKVIDIASKDVITIQNDQSLNDAVELMDRYNVRDIVVIEGTARRFGLITATDLIRFKVERVDFTAPIETLKIDHISTILADAPVLEALKEVQDSCNCLCVVDNSEKLCGFVTYTDIIRSVDPSVLMQEQKIKDILWTTIIKTSQADAQACDVLHMMSNHFYDAVVIYEGDEAVGIITTKDTIKLIKNGSDMKKPIRLYMSVPIRTIDEDATIQDALEFIKKEHFKRVIVSNKRGEIIGQISQQELLTKFYSRWAESLKAHDQQLEEVNKILEARASKFEEIAHHDPLTGLANRSSFEEKMLDEFERIERYGSAPFSLIFFDIDHFKSINDRYGHLTGDRILASTAKLCKSKLRINDMLARWGGEEFVAILPMTMIEAAYEVAEKLRAEIAAYLFEEVGHISCSFGVCQYHEGDTPQDMLHRTDEAMYKAKNSGRNRVVMHRAD